MGQNVVDRAPNACEGGKRNGLANPPKSPLDYSSNGRFNYSKTLFWFKKFPSGYSQTLLWFKPEKFGTS